MALDVVLLVASAGKCPFGSGRHPAGDHDSSLAPSSVFSARRAYALTNGNIWVEIGLLLLGLVSPVITIVTFVLMRVSSTTGEEDLTAPFCYFDYNVSDDVYNDLLIGTRITNILADFLLLVVTWVRMWPSTRGARGLNVGGTLATIFLRDGTTYFLLLLAANVVGLALSAQTDLLEPTTMVTSVLTSMLTSRFILDLHAAEKRLTRGGLSSNELATASLSDPVFNTAASTGLYGTHIGSIGGSADDDEEEQATDSEEEEEEEPRTPGASAGEGSASVSDADSERVGDSEEGEDV
ncbi:hypothetical protein BD413DRAFT_514922 [Trametes elegans]|nr:hypothetical protein BD413DRAFT_514922 [Trametes elegans]